MLGSYPVVRLIPDPRVITRPVSPPDWFSTSYCHLSGMWSTSFRRVPGLCAHRRTSVGGPPSAVGRNVPVKLMDKKPQRGGMSIALVSPRILRSVGAAPHGRYDGGPPSCVHRRRAAVLPTSEIGYPTSDLYSPSNCMLWKKMGSWKGACNFSMICQVLPSGPRKTKQRSPNSLGRMGVGRSCSLSTAFQRVSR